MSNLDRLNDDCLVGVLRQLDLGGVISASGVCRWTRAVALGTPELWTDVRWTQSITANIATDETKDAVQRARLSTLLSRSCSTDIRVTFSLSVTARPCTTLTDTTPNGTSTTDRAQAAVTGLVTLLSTLRTRIVTLTLDVSWPTAPNFLPIIDIDLPRLRTLDLRKTQARVVCAPRLTAVTYLDRGDGGLGSGRGPWGSGWPLVPNEPAAASPPTEELNEITTDTETTRLDEITELEVPLRIPLAPQFVPVSAVDVAEDMQDVQVAKQRGRRGSDGNGWLRPVLRAFPRLAHLRVWETAPHGPRSPTNAPVHTHNPTPNHDTNNENQNEHDGEMNGDNEGDGDWDGGGACTAGNDDAEQDALEHRHILKSVDIRRSGLSARYPQGVLLALSEHDHVGVHGIQSADDFLGLLSVLALSSSSNTLDVTRIAFAARAGADQAPALPFALGPRTSTVFALRITLSNGVTRSMSTLNRRVAVQSLERVLSLSIPPTSPTSSGVPPPNLELDGPFAWTALSDALRESARSSSPLTLAPITHLTMSIRTAVELDRVPPKGSAVAMPGLESLVFRAPSGVPVRIGGEAARAVAGRLWADKAAVKVGVVGVVLV